MVFGAYAKVLNLIMKEEDKFAFVRIPSQTRFHCNPVFHFRNIYLLLKPLTIILPMTPSTIIVMHSTIDVVRIYVGICMRSPP